MRIMGIDFGSKRIGIAMSDPGEIIASPYIVIESKKAKANLRALAELVKANQVEKIVVGMPYSFSGEHSIQTDLTIKFIESLKKAVAIPVEEYDERFTSVISERALIEAGFSRKKRKTKIDKVAASLMLQAYLDRQYNLK